MRRAAVVWTAFAITVLASLAAPHGFNGGHMLAIAVLAIGWPVTR